MCGTRNAPSKRSCEQPGGSSSHMPSEVDIGGSVPTWGVFDSLWTAMDAVLACARQRAALTRCCEVHPCGAVRGDVGRIADSPFLNPLNSTDTQIPSFSQNNDHC